MISLQVVFPSHRFVSTTLAAVVTAALLLGAGCDSAGPDDASSDMPPRPLTATEVQVVAADNAFGFELLRSTVASEAPSTNVFVSPISVSMALGMTLNGARGTTRDAMETALQKQGLSPGAINDAYRGLIDLLEGLDPSVEVALANSIWYRNDLRVHPAFIDTNKVHFDAEVAALDFSAPSASERINDWAHANTRGNISEIVPAQIPPEIVMYLINATYFKAPWRIPFDPSNTDDASFHRADGSTATVPMMERTDAVNAPFVRTDAFTAVDLAYGDSLYSMTILLPNEGTSVREVVDTLDADTWAQTVDQMRPTALSRLALPRFDLRYKKELKDVLTELGMGVAFTEQADFRGMADTALAISEVTHKTFLRVNEEGTEASAATSVGIGVTSAPPSFVVDRPFVVAIRENHTGTILFVGTVMDPTAAE
jgi:serpin B